MCFSSFCYQKKYQALSCSCGLSMLNTALVFISCQTLHRVCPYLHIQWCLATYDNITVDCVFNIYVYAYSVQRHWIVCIWIGVLSNKHVYVLYSCIIDYCKTQICTVHLLSSSWCRSTLNTITHQCTSHASLLVKKSQCFKFWSV